MLSYLKVMNNLTNYYRIVFYVSTHNKHIGRLDNKWKQTFHFVR